MQDVMNCGACESGQVCRLKDEGFIDLCPKRAEILKAVPQEKLIPKMKADLKEAKPKAVHKKKADGKKKQRRKAEDKGQFKLYNDKVI